MYCPAAWPTGGPTTRRRRPAPVSCWTVGVEVRRILLDQVEHRPAANFLATGQRDLHRSFQEGVAHLQVAAHLVAGQLLGLVAGPIPPHVVSPLLTQGVRDQHVGLLERGRGRLIGQQHARLITQLRGRLAKDVLSPEVFERVHPSSPE